MPRFAGLLALTLSPFVGNRSSPLVFSMQGRSVRKERRWEGRMQRLSTASRTVRMGGSPGPWCNLALRSHLVEVEWKAGLQAWSQAPACLSLYTSSMCMRALPTGSQTLWNAPSSRPNGSSLWRAAKRGCLLQRVSGGVRRTFVALRCRRPPPPASHRSRREAAQEGRAAHMLSKCDNASRGPLREATLRPTCPLLKR